MTAEALLALLPALTTAEQHDLLRLARRSIHAVLSGGAPPVFEAPTPALREPGAAFVSLHRAGHLRGCVGTLAADKPLYETVAQMALSAALDDPRFPPLLARELPAIAIEISRLSSLVPAQPEQVCPGVHGVSLMRGDRRGVFLPQVASTYHWDRETLLSELCRKAMLPSDSWKQPQTQLMVFIAEVFGEAESA